MSLDTHAQIERLGAGPLTEQSLSKHVWPLFSSVLVRSAGIYLANHSLGRPLDQTREDVGKALGLWYERLDDAWDHDGWPAQLDRFRSLVATLIGAAGPKSIVPKTSAGQGLRAVLNALLMDRPLRIVSTRGEFDSIDFILKTYAHRGMLAVDWVEPNSFEDNVPTYEPGQIIERINSGTDLVVVSAAFFGTGQILGDLPRIAAAAHAANALLLIDAYHAAGVIRLSMEDDGVDFMIGGSYKYTRGGPGACWLAIHSSVFDRELRTLDTGWFAKREPFSYARPDEPEWAEGGDGWMESTPPIIPFCQAASGLEFTVRLGVDRIREYSLRQQAMLRAELREHGVPHFEPSKPGCFGGFTLVPSNNSHELAKNLKAHGVTTDARGPFVRFGPDLLNSDDELLRAARITSEVLRSQ